MPFCVNFDHVSDQLQTNGPKFPFFPNAHSNFVCARFYRSVCAIILDVVIGIIYFQLNRQ